MASGQNKISPRKFSEKIALLNKKEAEGNAEFEEIIKEVQATRSQSANETSKSAKRDSNNNHHHPHFGTSSHMTGEQWRSEERKELEEVFQNLIKSVHEYDATADALEQQFSISGRHQTQQGSPADQSEPNSHSVSEGPAILNRAGFQDPSGARLPFLSPDSMSGMPVNCSQQAELGATNDLNIPIAPIHDQTSSSKVSVIMEGPARGQLQQHQQGPSPTCRARFSSIGAAMYRNLFANGSNSPTACAEQPTHREPVGAAGQNPVFLKPNQPGSERSWQKSCSDPTLNQMGVQATTSLGCDPCIDHLTNTNYCDAAIDMGNRMLCDQTDNETGSSYQAESSQSGELNHIDAACFPHHSTIQDHSNNEGIHYSQADSDLQKAEVPGIKICAIDDDSTLFRPPDPGLQNPQDGSLPDLAHLQFASSEKVANFEQQQILIPAYCHLNGNPVASSVYSSSQNIPFGRAQANDGDAYADDRAASAPYQTFQLANRNDHWANLTAMNETLYAPKVNNSLSVSECGLTATSCLVGSGVQVQVGANASGIMRSHSHNSIDHLTRRRPTLKQHNNTPINVGHRNSHDMFGRQVHQNMSSNRYDQQVSQFLGSQMDCDSSRYARIAGNIASSNSVEPQHGSVSPLDSSLSNLTSPQSEQNSPGSSNNEYGDYLPYSASASTNMAQTGGVCMPNQQQQQPLQPHYIEECSMMSGGQRALDETTTNCMEQVDFRSHPRRTVLVMQEAHQSSGTCITGSSSAISNAQQFMYHQSPSNQQQQLTSSHQQCGCSFSSGEQAPACKFHSCSTLMDNQSDQSPAGGGTRLSCRAYSNSSNSLRSSPSENH